MHISYEFLVTRFVSADIDECARGIHSCSSGNREACVNTPGSFICDCQQGYSRNADGVCTGNRYSMQCICIMTTAFGLSEVFHVGRHVLRVFNINRIGVSSIYYTA